MARAGISGLTIGAILLLIGGCFGAFVFVTRETSPRAQLVGRAHQPVPTDTRVAGATESMKRQLSPPSVPRLVYKKVEVHAKLYLDQINRLAHTKGCPEQTKLTLRAPVEIAKMQGYTLHEACANRPLEPEYTIVVSVSPEWLAYENALAAAEHEQETTAPATPSYLSSAVGGSAYSGSGNSSSQPGGDVQVRGYTRKDGTYVAPHTRSRPKK